MGQVLFVVWRESFEALLVIGIIYAWIKHHPDSRNGMKFLWGSCPRPYRFCSISTIDLWCF